MTERIKKMLNMENGVTRIPAQSERSFFFYLTIIAVVIYLGNRFLSG